MVILNSVKEVDFEKVPFIEGVYDLSQAVMSPKSGAVKNYLNYESEVHYPDALDRFQKYLLCDPQSNGGLLVSVAQEELEEVLSFLRTALGHEANVIGTFRKRVDEEKPLQSLRVSLELLYEKALVNLQACQSASSTLQLKLFFT